MSRSPGGSPGFLCDNNRAECTRLKSVFPLIFLLGSWCLDEGSARVDCQPAPPWRQRGQPAHPPSPSGHALPSPAPPPGQDAACCRRVGTAPRGQGQGSSQRKRWRQRPARWSTPFLDPRPLAAGSCKPQSSRVWPRMHNGVGGGLCRMKCFLPHSHVDALAPRTQDGF